MAFATIPDLNAVITDVPPSGTSISGPSNFADSMRLRVHRSARMQQNTAELYYYRDGAYHLMPPQPVMSYAHPIEIDYSYRTPASLRIQLMDAFGDFAPENAQSSYNYNAGGTYDPILDEARKVLLRVGTYCYDNLISGLTATFTASPNVGAASRLTDGVAGSYCQFGVPGAAAVNYIVFDLGSRQYIEHAVIRFTASVPDLMNWPDSVGFWVSDDNVNWNCLNIKPVGGPAGDWDDLPVNSQTAEFIWCNLQTYGRYVRFSVMPRAAANWETDECAVYGSATTALLGLNEFVGYLGDQIDISNDGIIDIVATGIEKKATDNNEVRLTYKYTLEETADIVYALLTATGYWKGSSGAYDAPFASGDIGWTSGDATTGLIYPLWQGQSNNLFGYAQELIYSIGAEIYGDRNGIWQIKQLPYRQFLPDRVLVGADDGNGEVRMCVRHRTGKDLRNVFVVESGPVDNGASTRTIGHPSSIARYGRRTTRILDPIADGMVVQDKIGQYCLRDYAWRVKALTCEFTPDPRTAVGTIFGFRAPARPSLYPKVRYTSAQSAVTTTLIGSTAVGQPSITLGVAPAVGSSIIVDVGGAHPETRTVTAVTPSGGNYLVSLSPVLIFIHSSGVNVQLYVTAVTTPYTIAELWTLKQYTDSISAGTREAKNAMLVPYQPLGPGIPINLDMSGVGSTELDIGFDQPSTDYDDITGYNLYYSSTGPDSGFPNPGNPQQHVTSPAHPAFFVTGLTPGQQYWFYVTSVGYNGMESFPSTVISGIAGGAVGDDTGWTVTDLAVSLNSVTPPQNANGWYVYEFAFSWTSPSYGFKHMELRYNVGALPSNPLETSSWQWGDEWHGDLVPAGLTWDRITAGPLTFEIRVPANAALPSTTDVYWRMWTWATTNGFGGPAHASNAVFATIP